MATEISVPVSYRSLLSVPGLPRLVVASLLGRTAIQMLSVAMVLFVLDRFHSPALAGVTVFAYAFPGIAVSPLAGALLDRTGRVGLIRLDYWVAGAALGLILLLDRFGLLDPGLLLGIAVLGSLTAPLSSAGTRSLFPVLVPRRLWDRANAMDSLGYLIAQVVGAPAAALIAGIAGRPQAVVATALVFAAAALSLTGVGRLALPPPSQPSGGLLRSAHQGLLYVARNPTLRGLAVSISTANLTGGLLIVGLPLVVLDRLHSNAAVIGILWAISAFSGAGAALLTGRQGSHGRERWLLISGMLATAAAALILAVAPDVAVAVLAMVVWGAAGGRMDVGLFSIRQRRTDPAWYGRAFAVSMSLNYAGSPIGSALAGPLLAPGLAVGLALVSVFSVAGAVIAWVMVPARQAPVPVAVPPGPPATPD